jgi:hypothetical protein
MGSIAIHLLAISVKFATEDFASIEREPDELPEDLFYCRLVLCRGVF